MAKSSPAICCFLDLASLGYSSFELIKLSEKMSSVMTSRAYANVFLSTEHICFKWFVCDGRMYLIPSEYPVYKPQQIYKFTTKDTVDFQSKTKLHIEENAFQQYLCYLSL